MKTRIRYLFIICFIIILGLTSRKVNMVPLFVGDLLYAMMIYFIVRFLLKKPKEIAIATIAILICCTIEFLQLYQPNWLFEIRKSTLGHLVLGQGFLWSDLLAYTFGIVLSYLISILISRKK